MKKRITKYLLAILAIICALFISGCEFESSQGVYGPPKTDVMNNE